MTTTMNPTALFQHYVQNIFKFPKEIKHDIVYCQRALKAHIKVHQMVLDVYKTQGNPNPAEKQRITEELETQIYEINAEQQFLLLRLRRQITDFHKTMERKGIHIIPNLINETISSELVPLINDQTFLVYPITVPLRSTEEELIEKYFEVKQNKTSDNYFEILDSDEEEEEAEKEQNDDNEMIDLEKPQRKASYKPISSKSNDETKSSWLKPLDTAKKPDSYSGSEFVEVSSDNPRGLSSITPNMTVSTIKRKSESTSTDSVYPVGISASKNIVERECDDDLLVSQNVKMSRMNLRQVLKNAQTGKLSTTNPVPKAPTQNQNQMSSEKKDWISSKKIDQNRIVGGVATTAEASTISSSSDDSTPERSLVPTQQTSSQFPLEKVETRLKPDDYGQEMFLRIFGLFTPEMQLQMQQRRSKRKRRTVQSNERSEYHYGHIEYASHNVTDDKKKRKAFLLSPQVKRKQGRPPKRRSIEKSDDTGTSRSSTSSPDDKHSCIECLKVGGTLERCDSCRYYYHHYCHKAANKSSYSNSKTKSCPPCRRISESEAQQNRSLQTSADQYKRRLTAEKTRRKSLQQKSQSFKMQMNALFNIIKAIKKDAKSNLS